jgi:tetratricopeptide (TPR) repeat protein
MTSKPFQLILQVLVTALILSGIVGCSMATASSANILPTVAISASDVEPRVFKCVQQSSSWANIAERRNADSTIPIITWHPEPSAGLDKRTVLVTQGNIIGSQEQPQGYALIYTQVKRQGASSGSLLDEHRRLIGINGEGDNGAVPGKKIDLGIPMQTLLASHSSNVTPLSVKSTFSSPSLIPSDFDKQGGFDFLGMVNTLGIWAAGCLEILFLVGIVTSLFAKITKQTTRITTSDNPHQLNYKYNEGTTKNIDAYIDQGNEGYKKGYLDQDISINPNDADVYKNGNLSGSKLGDTQGELPDFDQAISINPNDADAYYNRGLSRSKLGDNRGALADFEQAIRLNPNYGDAYYNRGLSRSKLGDNQRALADFDQAIRFNPNSADAYYNRGVSRSKLGDNRGGLADFDQAIRLNPKYGDAYNNRGVSRSKLGDNRGALADYNQAIRLNSNDADAYYNRGNSRSKLGDYQSALADYDQAIRITTNDADAYNNRGVSRSKLGDNQGALADYNQAIRINPYYADAYYNRGNARLGLGDNHGALADYQKAAELYKQKGQQIDYQDALNRGTKLVEI